MLVFRLSKQSYADSLSGKGTSLSGGRWNSKGTAIIYTASNRALAMAEVLVHLSLSRLPENYLILSILIPAGISKQIITPEKLPNSWNTFPYPTLCQKVGDNFVNEAKHCMLQVPSAVVKGDFNYLINPMHSEFKEITITEREPFPLDKRLFRL